MGCLKDYIDQLDNDIKVLETATTYTSAMVAAQDDVNVSLGNLQKYYTDTVNASDDFISEFKVLNKDGQGSAGRIKKAIDDALETAKDLYNQAVEDEKSCPICHTENGG